MKFAMATAPTGMVNTLLKAAWPVLLRSLMEETATPAALATPVAGHMSSEPVVGARSYA